MFVVLTLRKPHPHILMHKLADTPEHHTCTHTHHNHPSHLPPLPQNTKAYTHSTNTPTHTQTKHTECHTHHTLTHKHGVALSNKGVSMFLHEPVCEEGGAHVSARVYVHVRVLGGLFVLSMPLRLCVWGGGG